MTARSLQKGVAGKRKIGQIYDEFQTQLRQDVLDGGKVLDPPTGSGTLYRGRPSTETIGQTTQLAKKMRFNPPFSGMADAAPMINQHAKMNPVPGQIPKPTSSGRVKFIDDEERVYGWPCNDCVTLPTNALPILNNLSFTRRAIGQYQLIFAYREPTASKRTIESLQDTKHCSPSVLNVLLDQGGSPDSKERYVDIEDILNKWVLWGQVTSVVTSASFRTAGFPVVTSTVHGECKMVNIWAACYPPPRDGAYAWLVLTERPKDPILAGKYRDLCNRLLDMDLFMTTSQQALAKKDELIDEITSFFDEIKEFKYVLEPQVTYGPCEPPNFVIKTPRKQGKALFCGVFISGASGLKPPEAYRSAVDQVMYPDANSLDKFDYAVQILPTCRFAVNVR